MTKAQVLFVSWQGGCGHITRDLAVMAELRKIRPQIEVQWLSNPLASKVLLSAGEVILSESSRSADYNEILPKIVSGYSLNVTEYMIASQQQWERNIELFDDVVQKHRFDIILGDEIYELADALARGRVRVTCPLFMLEDLIGMQAMSDKRLERIAVQRINRLFVEQASILKDKVTRFFVGELEDVPEESFGSPPVEKREFAKTYYKIVGYIIRFDPQNYQDGNYLKSRLGYGNAPLLICATGGTAAGSELLELCGNAYAILKHEIRDLRMVCVCGESYGRLPPQLPSGIEVHSHIDRLYEHYAACDMAVVVGGGTTTVELTALHRPFIFFPLEGQFDQQIYISRRLARHGAGIRMTYNDTSPQKLAQVILENMTLRATWQEIPTDGAKNAAMIVNESLA